MTLLELDHSLPNGFHDAFIRGLQLDYQNKEARLRIDIWVGDISSEHESVRDAFRSGELVLSGLVFCVIEPPNSDTPFCDGSPLWIDAGPVELPSKPPAVILPQPLPPDVFCYWIFVREWNAFIYIAAMSAQLFWNEQNRSTQQCSPANAAKSPR